MKPSTQFYAMASFSVDVLSSLLVSFRPCLPLQCVKRVINVVELAAKRTTIITISTIVMVRYQICQVFRSTSVKQPRLVTRTSLISVLFHSEWRRLPALTSTVHNCLVIVLGTWCSYGNHTLRLMFLQFIILFFCPFEKSPISTTTLNKSNMAEPRWHRLDNIKLGGRVGVVLDRGETARALIELRRRIILNTLTGVLTFWTKLNWAKVTAVCS